MDPERRLTILRTLGITPWVRRNVRNCVGATVVGPEASVPEPAPDTGIDASTVASADSVAVLDWDDLEARVAACTACGLEAGRTQTVFGVGSRTADWVFVGEAPGAEEDRRGEPFVGRAGQLLDEALYALGLARDRVYIANILKCRPPRNRDPSSDEVACCEPYLLRQLELLSPKVIVALGRIAAQNLLKTDTPLGRLRGRVHAYGPEGIPLVVTYHPAYLLRSPGDKRKVWDDLQLARRTIAAAE